MSHQLPIWVARLSAEPTVTWHDPRRRQCSLASVTSFAYEGEQLVSVAYAEPSADLIPARDKSAPFSAGGVSGGAPALTRQRAAAALLALVLPLVGCSSLSGTGSKGYISGDGQVVVFDEADRKAPVEASGTTLDGDELDLADLRGKPVVVNFGGPCAGPAAPKRRT